MWNAQDRVEVYKAGTGMMPATLRRTPASNMAVVKFSTASVVVWALVLGLVAAQITFSRDWTGGKRAPAPLDCAQFTRLCHQFVHELKSSLAEPALRRRPPSGDPPTYDEE